MNYVFTQKELSYLDDLLPSKQHVKKRKLTLKDIDLQVLEKARKDQNEYIKRTSIIPESMARANKKGAENSGDDTDEQEAKAEKADPNPDAKPLI